MTQLISREATCSNSGRKPSSINTREPFGVIDTPAPNSRSSGVCFIHANLKAALDQCQGSDETTDATTCNQDASIAHRLPPCSASD
jgi:hypothetical protein